MKTDFGTILTAMVTPFDADLAVDYPGAERLALRLLDNGSDGVVVVGTTGESPTLTDAEKLELLRVIIGAVGDRGAVVAGTGTYDTRHTIELTRAAERCGADAALVVTPYYNKPPVRGLVEHFRAVAAATGLPVIIYNIPGRSGVNLPADALATLAEVENIVAVKQANPDREELDRVCAIDGLAVYAGNDDMLLDVVRRGGLGGICVASHVVGPAMAEVARLAKAGDLAAAEAADGALRPLFKALSVTTNPIPIKAALGLLGEDVGGLRLPLVEVDDAERAVVAGALRDLGLLTA
ncbi:MAG TPA: 4-hydroxy-tetrahydrodipicolinate synthase [Thermoleophilia bacterium]|nr:4-hydroxy-tetrahydrodipicolinate synthase [Thermoleophilia bacterium]HQG04055.1 4-hydroxy-tetrahydrodipicolinate synthase [Thermoleophilia bacterium]HQG54042.1 4-hydroxy-tetrahydrodipicolinate synthase [Thermoleophilia bacterium]HQJ97018.1 4-hydroxy-tetrahydrodipicolinate synthase [Thermoleophilia bacterium]